MAEPVVLTVLSRMVHVPLWHRLLLGSRATVRWLVFALPGPAREAEPLADGGFKLFRSGGTGVRPAFASSPEALEFLRSTAGTFPGLADLPGPARDRLIEYFHLTQKWAPPLLAEELEYLLVDADALLVWEEPRGIRGSDAERAASGLAAAANRPRIRASWRGTDGRDADTDSDAVVGFGPGEAEAGDRFTINPRDVIGPPAPDIACLVLPNPGDDDGFGRLMRFGRELAGGRSIGLKLHPDDHRPFPAGADLVRIGPADLLPALASGAPVLASAPSNDLERLCLLMDSSLQVVRPDGRVEVKTFRTADGRRGMDAGPADADVWRRIGAFLNGRRG